VGWSELPLVTYPKQFPFMFQSLRGFGVGWSLSAELAGGDVERVSIPERVWGGLEQIGTARGNRGSRFQSLRGFGVGWSSAAGCGRSLIPGFNP